MFVIHVIVVVFEVHDSSFEYILSLFCLLSQLFGGPDSPLSIFVQIRLWNFDARLQEMGRGDLGVSKQFLRMIGWDTHDSHDGVLWVFLCFDVWVFGASVRGMAFFFAAEAFHLLLVVVVHFDVLEVVVIIFLFVPQDPTPYGLLLGLPTAPPNLTTPFSLM